MRQQRNTKTWFPSLKTTSFLYPNASHLKSHLSLIMDPENALLPTNNTSRSVLIMHTKPPGTILSSEHTLSHPDNKTPSNRLSSTLSHLRHHTHLSSPLYPIYYIYPIYCIYPLYPGHSIGIKKHRATHSVPPDERI